MHRDPPLLGLVEPDQAGAEASAPQALRLLGAVLAAGPGAGAAGAAAARLVGALVASQGLRRAALGLVAEGKPGTLPRLRAVSGLDIATLPRASEATHGLAEAMQEAMEQGEALQWPPADAVATNGLPATAPTSSGATAPQAAGRATDVTPWGPVRLAQRLLQQRVGGSVASLPLAIEGRLVGALTIESDEAPAALAARLGPLQDALLLAAPMLALMQHGEASRWRQLRRALGPRPPAAPTGPLQAAAPRRWGRWALAAVLAWLALWPAPWEVAARARVEGELQRVLVAPAEGFIKAVHARPGDRVARGAVLADLVDEDLLLERQRWQSQLAQFDDAYASALARDGRGEAAIALARRAEAEAQLALVDERLARVQLTAPFDGTVIAGDLAASVGAPVRQGDALLTLAADGARRVVAEVDEADIARLAPGQLGEVALSALPWDTLPLRVRRVSPLAQTAGGANVFEVDAELLGDDPRLRPGLQGHARFETGRRPLLWTWLGRLADRLRLLWWQR